MDLRGPDYDRSTQHLNVRVNGQNIAFNEKSLFWQDYKVNTDDRNEQSNFTVLLSNGIGFQIAEPANTLQIDLMFASRHLPGGVILTRAAFKQQNDMLPFTTTCKLLQGTATYTCVETSNETQACLSR
ncbi:hypothetical protein DPMN_050477 [Dreissena polymorpha]|uniref:Uncharacterized protein n=1 Tax=Dreissena polymorpha TaxID=45954 RepID=A0A9D4CG72_DREPO|nr:hypothetical protein DPMN_050477 [Dreissena polymorpha]